MEYDINYILTDDIFAKVHALFPSKENNEEFSSENSEETSQNIPLNISNESYDNLTQDQKALYLKDFFETQTQFTKYFDNPLAVISGITGVWSNESALKRHVTNKMEEKKWTGEESYKAGRGIAQWSLGRNKKYKQWSGGIYANEDTIDNQLHFAILEALDRPALMNALSKAQTPEEAADIWRRGFENGSRNALATSKHMDRYINVGSSGADAIYKKDTKKANYFYDLFTGNSLLNRTNQKMQQYGNIWQQS